MKALVVFVVEGADERDLVREPRVELGLQCGLERLGVDRRPGLHRLPHEHECHLAGTAVVEPHLLRQERDPLESLGERLLAISIAA